jgi:hypothetical protein
MLPAFFPDGLFQSSTVLQVMSSEQAHLWVSTCASWRVTVADVLLELLVRVCTESHNQVGAVRADRVLGNENASSVVPCEHLEVLTITSKQNVQIMNPSSQHILPILSYSFNPMVMGNKPN